MKTLQDNPPKGRFAHLLIWTIREQNLIAYHVRIYVWSGVIILLLLTLSQKISLETALYALLVSGVIIGLGLWIAIERRRSWLLRINDPDLKQEAYDAMLTYLAQKTRTGEDLKNLAHMENKKIVQKNESYTH